ncbi:MAG: hypothetical protein ACYC6G_16930 [Desulfobaccales bacterium]
MVFKDLYGKSGLKPGAKRSCIDIIGTESAQAKACGYLSRGFSLPIIPDFAAGERKEFSDIRS